MTMDQERDIRGAVAVDVLRDAFPDVEVIRK